MIKKRLRLLIVFFFFTIVACGGLDVQPESTLTPAPSTTPSPEPTNTPESTHTPLPTDTPPPTATATPIPTTTLTPTPTPQVGETRINPDTGKEEIFADTGEWDEIPEKWAEQENLETGQAEIWDGSRWSQVVKNHVVIDGLLFVKQETEWGVVNFNDDIRDGMESGLLEIDHLKMFDQAGGEGVGLFDSEGRMVVAENFFQEKFVQTYYEQDYLGNPISIEVVPNTESTQIVDAAEVDGLLQQIGPVLIPNVNGYTDVVDETRGANPSGHIEVRFYDKEDKGYDYTSWGASVHRILPLSYSREIWEVQEHDQDNPTQVNAFRMNLAYMMNTGEIREGQIVYKGEIKLNGEGLIDVGKLEIAEDFDSGIRVGFFGITPEGGGGEEYYRRLYEESFPTEKGVFRPYLRESGVDELFEILKEGGFVLGDPGGSVMPTTIRLK